MKIQKNSKESTRDPNLFLEIKEIIQNAKEKVARTINTTLVATYWYIGKRINDEVLENKRAGYGKEIVKTLSVELTQEYGRGWSEKQLRHCLRFAETFADLEIVSALQRQLSWTHFKTIIYLKTELQREFKLVPTLLRGNAYESLWTQISSFVHPRLKYVFTRKPWEQG